MTNTPSAHASLPPLPATLLELAGAVDLPDPLDAPPLRWGIIGAGGIAHTFATDVPAHTRSTVAAVAARDQSRADAFAHAHDIPRAYGSYEELVEDPDVDAVYVATIHPRHADNAVLALQAGKPWRIALWPICTSRATGACNSQPGRPRRATRSAWQCPDGPGVQTRRFASSTPRVNQ